MHAQVHAETLVSKAIHSKLCMYLMIIYREIRVCLWGVDDSDRDEWRKHEAGVIDRKRDQVMLVCMYICLYASMA